LLYSRQLALTNPRGRYDCYRRKVRVQTF
jgi:hypothetical protein